MNVIAKLEAQMTKVDGEAFEAMKSAIMEINRLQSFLDLSHKDVDISDFNPVSNLPEEHLIVSVLYDSGYVGFSWREGSEDDLGHNAFDENHGKVTGWKMLLPGQKADSETIRMHAEMMSKLSLDHSVTSSPRSNSL